MLAPVVRGVLARWFLIATAVALVLLGRPMDRPAVEQSDDDYASSSDGDEVALSSEQRDGTAPRTGDEELDEDAWSVDLAISHANNVLRASVMDLTFAAARGEGPRPERSSSLSARGPPATA